jgi:hypothetical protein
MPKFPYGPRPVPRQIQYTRRDPQPIERNAEHVEQPERDLLKNAAFSPELSFLLAMTMKDGLRQGSAMDLLKSIEPYVSSSDREAIHQLLGAQKAAEEYRKNPPAMSYGFPGAGLNNFSRMSRQQALLEILQHYASNESSDMMRALQRSSQMQDNFDKMIKRMEKLRHMNMAKPEDMFEAMSMFMPQDQQSQFKNMQNMMRMMSTMGNMNGFKPEDMFKFMNNQR